MLNIVFKEMLHLFFETKNSIRVISPLLQAHGLAGKIYLSVLIYHFLEKKKLLVIWLYFGLIEEASFHMKIVVSKMRKFWKG